MEQMSVKDVLEIVLKTLSNIQVPAALVEQIGIPVSNSIRNIRMCIDAINAAKQRKETEGSDSDVQN